MNVYVAASFVQVAKVRETHAELERRGLRWTSTWVHAADGKPETLDEMTEDERFRIAEENDNGVRRADVVLVLASDGARETFCEARFACEIGRPVLWVGWPRPLTAYRRQVERFDSLELALAFLHGLGLRGLGDLQNRRAFRRTGVSSLRR